MKTCGKCGVTKDLDLFARCAKARDGRQYQCKACEAEYRIQNKERVQKVIRKWHAEHREDRREYAREYRAKNVEQMQEKRRARYAQQAEEARRYSREWYAQNKEHVTAYQKEYSKAHRDKVITHKHNHRARRINAEGSHTTEEWRGVVERQRSRCAVCGTETRLERDHIIPLSKGGSNNISNIQGLCRSCNLRKGTTVPKQEGVCR
jgi:5-methylcytosine-specific restriction endonuclease McrA